MNLITPYKNNLTKYFSSPLIGQGLRDLFDGKQSAELKKVIENIQTQVAEIEEKITVVDEKVYNFLI
jgi:hypothetical protein